MGLTYNQIENLRASGKSLPQIAADTGLLLIEVEAAFLAGRRLAYLRSIGARLGHHDHNAHVLARRNYAPAGSRLRSGKYEDHVLTWRDYVTLPHKVMTPRRYIRHLNDVRQRTERRKEWDINEVAQRKREGNNARMAVAARALDRAKDCPFGLPPALLRALEAEGYHPEVDAVRIGERSDIDWLRCPGLGPRGLDVLRVRYPYRRSA